MRPKRIVRMFSMPPSPLSRHTEPPLRSRRAGAPTARRTGSESSQALENRMWSRGWGCSRWARLLGSTDSLACGESSSWKAAGAGLSNSQHLAEPCLSDLRQHPEAQAKLPIHQWFSTGHGFASQRSSGNVGRDFWLAQVRRCGWHLVGRGQRCC